MEIGRRAMAPALRQRHNEVDGAPARPAPAEQCARPAGVSRRALSSNRPRR